MSNTAVSKRSHSPINIKSSDTGNSEEKRRDIDMR